MSTKSLGRKVWLRDGWWGGGRGGATLSIMKMTIDHDWQDS